MMEIDETTIIKEIRKIAYQNILDRKKSLSLSSNDSV